MQSNPLVSVIIPVYNCEKYLAQAIESVLEQDYHPLEVIIIDDGSTDQSSQIAKDFLPRVKYYFQENQGLAASLNQGVLLSQGEYLSFLDSDDLWVKSKLASQMMLFTQSTDLEAVFSHVKQFKSPELDEESKAKISILDEVIPGYFKGTMLIKRDAFQRIGKFDTQWKLGDFIDWYSRAKESNLKSLMQSEILMQRRIHKTNMGIKDVESRSEYARVLKAALDRRRKLMQTS